MKPRPFEYHRPDELGEAAELLSAHGGSARILAGGQSLMPLLNARALSTDHLVDINGLTELEHVERRGDTLVIGALVRQARALTDAVVKAGAPLVPRALEQVANHTVRNRGTVCGSVAFASPSSELPSVALAIGGEVLAQSAGGARVIPLEKLFVGPFQTALVPEEVLTELRLRSWSAHAGQAFLEVGRLRWPVVTVSALVELDQGVVSRCAVALSGVAGTPIRAHSVERALTGKSPDDRVVEEAAEGLDSELDPPSNAHGSATYRRRIAHVLVRRAVLKAARKAGGEQ